MAVRPAPPQDRNDPHHKAESSTDPEQAADEAAAEDFRLWRQDPNKKFGESFDQWRAARPARSGAAGSHTLPPSMGTDPGQPHHVPPGASGKNK